MISSILGKKGGKKGPFTSTARLEPLHCREEERKWMMENMSTDNREENEKAKKVLSRLRGDITLLIHTKMNWYKLIHTFLDESQIMFCAEVSLGLRSRLEAHWGHTHTLEVVVVHKPLLALHTPFHSKKLKLTKPIPAVFFCIRYIHYRCRCLLPKNLGFEHAHSAATKKIHT